VKKVFILPFLVLTIALPTNADNIISRCAELAENLNLPGNACDGEVTGLEKQLQRLSLARNKELVDLGIYLRQLGYLDAAKYVLGVAISHVPIMDNRYPEIQLSIANITYAEYKNAVLVTDIYDPELIHKVNSEGVQKAQQALKEYEQLFETSQTLTSIKASLNWLRLWSELNQSSSKIRVLKESNAAKAAQVVRTINDRLSNNSLESNNEHRINLAETLIQADVPAFQKIAEIQLKRLMQSVDPSLQPRTYSRTLGARGTLYQSSSPVSAIDSFSKARQAALLGQFPELVYRWDAALGKLYRSQGKLLEARKIYKEAMQQIEAVRDGSTPFVRNVQYQSYSHVLPIYRDYLDLLFSDKQLDYAEILKTYEIQKQSELEYYLQCSQINATGLSQLSSDQLADVTIYIIRRPAQYEIVARYKNGNVNHHSIDATQLDRALTEAKKYSNAENLKVASSDVIYSIFGRLYSLILLPFEKSMPPNGSSVTFVTDFSIQNIPLNALYTPSGQYLLQKYVISFSPGVKKVSQRAVLSDHQKMVVAGMSVGLQEYPSLPAVQIEVNNISQIFPHAKRLLNSGFKKDDFFKFGTKANILHIASHAVFSSDPQATFILAWDGKIGLGDLQRFGDLSSEPLDLLFFSSCESSKGSPISVLGITGTSLRAGARAAIATQWKLDDQSMADLATNFYRGLQSGQSTAEALRSAQIKALQSNNPKFKRFSNWAGVGLYEN
jgi:CHAT domain-containing protein